MTVLDQFGKSIPAAAIRQLREEAAPPTLAGVRPAISGQPADGLTPARLARILRAAAEGDSMRYLELAEIIEERDLHYAGVLGTRKRSVSQLPITLEAASDKPEHVKHKDFVQTWLNKGILEAALFDMLDGVGKGFSVLEIDWRTEPDGFWPRKFTYRPQRWFEVDHVDLETILLREGAGFAPLQPHKFVVHRHPNKSGLVMRSGLAFLATWSWMAKAFTVRDWSVFVQNYGQPVRIGKYGPASTVEDRRVLWSAVANIAGDCAAIIPRDMEIEFIEVGDVSKGSDLYERRCDWLDRQISKAVLGQTATTDAIQGGYGVGKVHRQVQEDIERADGRLLSGTISQQIVQAIVAFNFGPQAEYPKLLVGRPDEVAIDVVVAAVEKLTPFGFRVEQSQVRDRLGLAEPGKDSEIFVASPPVTATPSAAPAAPAPAEAKPPALALNSVLALAAHQLQTPEVVERLSERLALDAQGALAGMTGQIRAVLEEATDWPDAMARIAKLELNASDFGHAMAQAMAVAHLAGRAEVMDELAPPARQ